MRGSLAGGDELRELAQALQRRLEVIADHSWRDRDADGHLAALREVSERIGTLTTQLGGRLPPRLEHFLRQCSFDKALAFIEESGR